MVNPVFCGLKVQCQNIKLPKGSADAKPEQTAKPPTTCTHCIWNHTYMKTLGVNPP